MKDAAIRNALRTLLDEPADVRERVSKKLAALADEVGDMDPVRSRGLDDVATLLRYGSFIPPGASRD